MTKGTKEGKLDLAKLMALKVKALENQIKCQETRLELESEKNLQLNKVIKEVKT